MAFFATLKFGNNDSGRYNREYPVMSARSRFLRDSEGLRPDSSFRCEKVTITLIVPQRTDVELYDWFVSGSCLSGCIEMEESSSSEDSRKRVMTFENAQCFGLREEYDSRNNRRQLLTIEMVAERIVADDVEFCRF
ncbi:MAG: hypothetical protein MJY56_06615 [Bacteroidales bacterium]|nr:hypothetical protein [Bacteroidales bacterium]